MHYDAVVVGAGPAGLEAARVLAESGKNVVILEKNREDDLGNKPCAGIIFNRIEAYQFINDLIPENVYHDTLNDFVFSCGHGKVHFSDPDGICRLLDRKILAKAQLKIAEKAGVEFIHSAKVNAVDLKNNIVKTESGDSFGYSTIIGADGSMSVIRRALGLRFEGVTTFQYVSEERYDSPLTVYFDPKTIGWYAWHVPHPDFSIIGCGTLPDIHDTSEAREGLKRICEMQDYNLKGEFQAAPINLSCDGHRFGNAYLVGDAGGFTPFSGEGIALAAYSGNMIAREILGADISSEMRTFRQVWAVNKLFLRLGSLLKDAISNDLAVRVLETGLSAANIELLNNFLYRRVVNRVFGGMLFV